MKIEVIFRCTISQIKYLLTWQQKSNIMKWKSTTVDSSLNAATELFIPAT